MSPYNSLKGNQLIALVLFIVAIACVIGVLNGMYSMDMLARSGDGLGAVAIEAKTSRAMLYGGIALVCIIAGMVLSLMDWLRMPRR